MIHTQVTKIVSLKCVIMRFITHLWQLLCEITILLGKIPNILVRVSQSSSKQSAITSKMISHRGASLSEHALLI